MNVSRRFLSFFVVAVLLVAIAAVIRPGFAATSTQSGVIVPLYTYPTDSTWSTVVQAKQAYPSVPIIVIADPTSSGAGASINQGYVTGIQKLQTAGIQVVGYVDTTYASRSLASAEQDISNWVTWYHPDGIFLDEVPSSGSISYYSSLTQYIKSQCPCLTIANAGTATSLSSLFDITMQYEEVGVPPAGSGDYLAYKVSSLPSSFPSASWLYITNDDLPNPWDTLPPYFAAEVAALDPPAVTTSVTTSVATSNVTISTVTTTVTTTAIKTITQVQTPSVTVLAVDQLGAPLDLWVGLFNQYHAAIGSGYAPLSYSGLSYGKSYMIEADSFGTCIVNHWKDSGPILSGDYALRSFVVTGLSQTFTIVYNC